MTFLLDWCQNKLYTPSMKIDFTKMNGLGNDFVIIDARKESVNLNNKQNDSVIIDARAKSVNLNDEQKITLASRNNPKTKGCDQLIILEPSKKANLFMRIYNRDGSEAQSCGNATRCVAALLTEANESINIETIERILLCYNNGNNTISVNMGKAISHEKIDLGDEYKEFGQAVSVNVGNPHCIFFVDNTQEVNLKLWGPKIENHSLFPERTNVEFVSQIPTTSPYEYRVRVWERGAGITKACGSGAVAVAWAIKNRGSYSPIMHLHMDGGEITIKIEKDDSIIMQAPTELEFTATINI